ncbi:MAG: DUF4294 domain-containing protein [Bacteroidales bacterium]|nr:DUF4294 domain-containing protein [Bacteroidales bacterium]
MGKRTFRFIFIAGLFYTLNATAWPQDTVKMEYGGYPVYGRIVDGDTVMISNIREANIYPRQQFDSRRDLRQYERLIYNVKKAYPYALIAGEMFREVEKDLAGMNTEKERKEYIKQVEKDLKDRFEGELTKLTITQGRILIKLVDRETRHTSYDLVKELRGSFQAFFWQAIARIFGSNLKSRYDPAGEDYLIEEIIIMIDVGMI